MDSVLFFILPHVTTSVKGTFRFANEDKNCYTNIIERVDGYEVIKQRHCKMQTHHIDCGVPIVDSFSNWIF